MPRGLWRWAVALFLVFLVAAGGEIFGKTSNTSSSSPANGGGTTTTQPAVGSDYLANGPLYVDYIQWTDVRGRLRGLAEFVSTQGTVPNQTTTTNTLPVVGKLNRSNISLSFNGAPDAVGTLSGDSFTLNFAQPEGTMAPVTFRSATAAQYDSAVAHLNERVNLANARARLQRPATQKQAVDLDVSKVAQDLTNVSQDESSMPNLGQGIPTDVQVELRDLSSTLGAEDQVTNDAQNGMGSGQGSATCTDAQSVVSDADGVEADAQVVEADAQTVEGSSPVPSGIGALRADINSLDTDFAQYQADQARLPRYHPAQAPTQAEVSQVVAAAQPAMSSTLNTVNGYVNTANSGVTQAFLYVSQAFAAGGCGTAPAAPTALANIS